MSVQEEKIILEPTKSMSNEKRFEMCSINSNDVTSIKNNFKNMREINGLQSANSGMEKIRLFVESKDAMNNMFNIGSTLSSYNYTNFKCINPQLYSNGNLAKMFSDANRTVIALNRYLMINSVKNKLLYPKIKKFIDDMEADLFPGNEINFTKNLGYLLSNIKDIISPEPPVQIEQQTEPKTKIKQQYLYIAIGVLSFLTIIFFILFITK